MLRRKRGTLPIVLIGLGMLLLTAAQTAFAADIQNNDNAPVLRLGAGARALGMGGAFVGVADDATAAYWNPAGLAWTSGWEVTGMYTAAMNYDRTHNYVAVSHNGEKFAVALQWINAGMDKIDQYDATGAYLGQYKFGFNALSLSLAKQFDVFSVGITGKYLHQGLPDVRNISDDSETGFGLDLGAGAALSDWARLGLSVQNVAGKLGAKNAPDDTKTIPATLRAGFSVMPMDGLTAAFDLEKTRDEDYRFHMGGEFAVPLTDQLGAALRLGLNHNKFAGGLGIRFNVLTFDYAYVVEPEKFLDENHRFSVSLNFGHEAAGPAHKMADRDGDGIPDDQDQCPDLAEDFDGFADSDGCPDLDNDGDGIPDVNDDCPNKAEDFEGYQDTDGCPEGGPPPAPVPPPAPPAPPAIPTLAYINFKFATAEISGADPIPVLEDVARIMKERPEIKVQITGHTDAIGGEDANMKLSLRRADAVKDYLVKRGIDTSRLLTQGKGKSSPIDTNDTEIGRARNRRIEFSIVQ